MNTSGNIAVIAVILGMTAVWAGFETQAQTSWQVISSTVRVTVCGNNIAEQGEECDGDDLRGETCASLGHGDGPLSCASDCTFDTSACNGDSDPEPSPSPSPGMVVFSGKASPGNKVTLLKDSQQVATVTTDSNADWQIFLGNLSTGSYIFSLYGEDKNGLVSSLATYAINVTAGTTTNVTNIFIPPTIALDKTEVRHGDFLTIFGQTAPLSEILIAVHSDEHLVDTTADEEGMYLYRFDTSPLAMGDHTAKTKASKDNQLVSEYGQVAGFKVGTQNIYTSHVEYCPLIGDFNSDCRVNLVDFSILAYWYLRPNPPSHLDLNGDGKIDLIDFSILAFHWTG